MRNLRIGLRLLLGFGVIVLLTMLLGWYSLTQQARVRDFTGQMDSRDFRVLAEFRRVAQSEDEMRATRYLAMQAELLRRQGLSAEEPARYQARWQQAKDKNLKILSDLQSAMEAYETSALGPERSAQWRKIRGVAGDSTRALQALVPEVEQVFRLSNQGDLKQAIARMPELDRLRDAFERTVDQAESLTNEQVEIGRREVTTFYERSRDSVLLALALALVLATVSAVVIQRSITRPLALFSDVVQRVGKGDLTQRAAETGRDELGELARVLNQMVLGLKDVASQSRTAAENLGAATAEILASTQQQAAGAAEQAAAVQQTTATLAELTQSGTQISERAKQVAASAEATSSSSAAGLQAVRNTSVTMAGIREQAQAVAENVVALSDKTQAVGEIIATVNDIAEQSHLLALNAAIEAAAAGEHGRSFSVVAAEMKNLADQSKEATVQVRSILGDIQKGINRSVMLTEEAVKRVESGRQQAEVADGSIRQLTENIQQSVQAFQQIVAGSSQQQIGFDQVIQAIRNINLATGQTAASTRQSEKAAANLNALAQQLRSTVERYRL